MSTASNSNKKILATVTGASGLVGAAIVVEFLRRGHSVRLPLRKQEQIDAWVTEYGKQYPGQIEGVLLKGQIWDEGVFDEAVKGVDAVVHAASPADLQIKTDAETDILKPAVAGTLSILESAKKVPSIKSVAVTSSIVAYIDMDKWVTAGPDALLDEQSWSTVTYEAATKFSAEQGQLAYAASKGAAESAALDFAKQPDVHFALSTHAPTCVLGRNYAPGPKTLKTAGSTVAMALNMLWDQKDFTAAAAFEPDTFVWVEDVARSHVAAALNPSISAGHRYLLINARSSWKQLIRYSIKAQPELKAHLPSIPDQPTEDEVPTNMYSYDSSRAEKDFGFKYESMENIAASFAQYVAEVAKSEGAL